MAPSAERLPAFLSALAMPFFLSHSMAFSMSPPLSTRAFLVSAMPAPQRWRNSLTSAAEMTTTGLSASAFGSSLGFSSAFGASAFGSSAGAAAGSDLYFSSSCSTPPAKSASLFSRPSPKVKRAKRRMTRFSPSFAMRSLRISSTVLSSSLSHFWPMRATSSNCFFSLPSTIFSLTLSGLPSRSSFAISTTLAFAFSSSDTSAELT
mmetsp:Transcript_162266/g.515503  ORF Transcript_162266/g.515503 Transcript_162266/m.515503 type:complete len:206 (-) Transcript_162266:406-1023(-)